MGPQALNLHPLAEVDTVIESKRRYYLRNKELVKQRSAAWKKEHRDRVALLSREYYERNKEKCRAYNYEYRRTRKTVRSYDKDKRAVHSKVAYAIKVKRLIKGVCEVCGEDKVHAHHDDYSKPFSVRWLCRKHHSELHRIEGTYAKLTRKRIKGL